MASSSTSKLLFCVLASLFLVTSAQNCSNYTFTANKTFTYCKTLPYLEANLHWNYNSSSTKVSIAYRAKQDPKGWVAWAINPTRKGMVGSQALVAFHNTNGSMIAYTTQVTSYSTSMQKADLSFQVSYISAEYLNNEMTIFATIGPLGNGTTVNHVWQGGSSVASEIPQMHSLSSPHLQSFGQIDFHSTMVGDEIGAEAQRGINIADLVAAMNNMTAQLTTNIDEVETRMQALEQGGAPLVSRDAGEGTSRTPISSTIPLE
ncbi:hypothetical protein RND71_008327 [Anisodus tanguticus]|uniref:DOMON domain-containing protein n=1 Tax=Anisodus tanguticus TaxID=243964 RepID=A0AAE1SKL5_9SOLA|nr:hypothetical protein RND71_008327 [Anisodus tanguticus]